MVVKDINDESSDMVVDKEPEDNTSTLDLSMSTSNSKKDSKEDNPTSPTVPKDSNLGPIDISLSTATVPLNRGHINNALTPTEKMYHGSYISDRPDQLNFDKPHPRVDHEDVDMVDNVINEDDNEQSLDLSKNSSLHGEDESVDLSKPKVHSPESEVKESRLIEHSIHKIANNDKDSSRDGYDESIERDEEEGQHLVGRYSPAIPLAHGLPHHSQIHSALANHIPYPIEDEDDCEPPQHPIKCPIPRPAGALPPASFDKLPHSLHRSSPSPPGHHSGAMSPPPPGHHGGASSPPPRTLHGSSSPGLPPHISVGGVHPLAHHHLQQHHQMMMDGSPSQGSDHGSGGSGGLNQSPAHPLNLHQSPAHPPPVSTPNASDLTASSLSFHPSSGSTSGYLPSPHHGGGLGDSSTGSSDPSSAAAAAHLAAAGLPYSQYSSSPYNHHYFSNASSYSQNFMSSHGFPPPPSPHSFSAASQAAAEQMRSMMGSHEMYMSSQSSAAARGMHDTSSPSVASSLKEFGHHPGLLGGLGNHHSPRQVQLYID